MFTSCFDAFVDSRLDSSYWPHESPSFQTLTDGDCFKLQHCYDIQQERFRTAVRCDHCDICIWAEEWIQECSFLYRNPEGVHIQKSPQCALIVQYRKKIEEIQRDIAKEQQQTEEVRIAKERAEAFACRRCPAKFPSNTKLHQHIQDHHQKKSAKPASEIAASTPNSIPTPPTSPRSELAVITSNETAMPTSLCTSKTPNAMLTFSATSPPASEPTLMLTTPHSPSKLTSKPSPPMTPSATPKKALSWAEIASRTIIAPKPSRLPKPTPKPVPTCTETPSANCPPTLPANPPLKPTPKHQKPYLTIHDLFEMFAEKPKVTDLVRTKKCTSSPKISYQARITSYFKPAANRNLSISQASETPKPMSFQQHTTAEAIRTTSSKWSEKLAISPYKIRPFSGRLSYAPSARNDPLPSGTPPAPFGISASCHSCRICSGTFRSNNGLHQHLRAIHFGQPSRQRHEILREHGHEHGRELGRKQGRKLGIKWRGTEPFPYFFRCITNRFLQQWTHVPRGSMLWLRGRSLFRFLWASVMDSACYARNAHFWG